MPVGQGALNKDVFVGGDIPVLVCWGCCNKYHKLNFFSNRNLVSHGSGG